MQKEKKLWREEKQVTNVDKNCDLCMLDLLN